MKVSIILPVYNVEGFIGFALESIYNQKLDENDFEVIIVDDGSTDHFLKEVIPFKASHKNIIFLQQENQGVSVARNNGISHASGEYICFVDPDDTLVEGALSSIFALIESNHKADIIIAQSFYNNNEICTFPNSYDGKCITIEQALESGYRRGCVWGCLYKKDLIGGEVLFPEGVILAEDTIFFSLALIHSKELYFCKVPMYILRYRETSASHTYSLARMKTYKKNIDYIYDYRTTHANLNNYQALCIDYASYVSISNAVHYYTHLKKKNFSEISRILEVKKILPLAKDCIPPHGNLKVRLMNKSFYLFYILTCFKSIFLHSDE